MGNRSQPRIEPRTNRVGQQTGMRLVYPSSSDSVGVSSFTTGAWRISLSPARFTQGANDVTRADLEEFERNLPY